MSPIIDETVGLSCRIDAPHSLTGHDCPPHVWVKEPRVMGWYRFYDAWICLKCGAGGEGESVRDAVRECVDDR